MMMKQSVRDTLITLILSQMQYDQAVKK